MVAITDSDAQLRLLKLGEVFTPSAPIDDADLFAGRNHEMFTVIEAMQSAGQHAVIYGERGVGKTSLARITAMMGQKLGYLTARINCESYDTYESLWIKVLDELEVVGSDTGDVDPRRVDAAVGEARAVFSSEVPSMASVRKALRRVSALAPVVVYLDEFNEVQDTTAISTMSNTIKAFSDHIERITIIPVGVAEDLDALLEGHLSAVRAIAQVKMPRMDREEIEDIVVRGLRKLDMSIDGDALEMIRVIPRGLPQYAHLLAQEGARSALINQRSDITKVDVQEGLKVGLAKLDRSLSKAYDRATYSPKKNTRFREVLLACAIARLGDMGDFSPSDIRLPYSRIIGESVGIDRFNPQLTSLATTRDILIREGEDRRWRYRFKDPLMEPYVLLEGLSAGSISTEDFPH